MHIKHFHLLQNTNKKSNFHVGFYVGDISFFVCEICVTLLPFPPLSISLCKLAFGPFLYTMFNISGHSATQASDLACATTFWGFSCCWKDVNWGSPKVGNPSYISNISHQNAGENWNWPNLLTWMNSGYNLDQC